MQTNRAAVLEEMNYNIHQATGDIITVKAVCKQRPFFSANLFDGINYYTAVHGIIVALTII